MRLPLEGMRIINLAEQYPGPYASLLLADLGAEVILVERAAGGDPARQFPDFHAALNRNKRSVTLDLKSEEGREALRKLIADADVLMEGFRPGTMARLGFDYAEVDALNPKIVYVSISGFGQSGPYRDRPAHDLSYQAIAGLLFRQADSGTPEQAPDLAIGDLSSGMFAVVGILSAMLERTRTGKGKYIDVSMTDGLVSWMTTCIGPVMNGGEIASINAEPAYGVFKCGDGKLLTLSIAHEDWFWKPLCMLLGMAEAATLHRPERVTRETELRALVSARLRDKPRQHWAEAFDAAGIPWGPVNTIEEVAADPHFRHRGMFRSVTGRDGKQAWHVAQPLVFGDQHPGPRHGVPGLGEDTAEVLKGLLLTRE